MNSITTVTFLYSHRNHSCCCRCGRPINATALLLFSQKISILDQLINYPTTPTLHKVTRHYSVIKRSEQFASSQQTNLIASKVCFANCEPFIFGDHFFTVQKTTLTVLRPTQRLRHQRHRHQLRRCASASAATSASTKASSDGR